jgi:hypothetical protein
MGATVRLVLRTPASSRYFWPPPRADCPVPGGALRLLLALMAAILSLCAGSAADADGPPHAHSLFLPGHGPAKRAGDNRRPIAADFADVRRLIWSSTGVRQRERQVAQVFRVA